jgi:hypothetical protein
MDKGLKRKRIVQIAALIATIWTVVLLCLPLRRAENKFFSKSVLAEGVQRTRQVYPYSVVAGGVDSAEDVRRAVADDSSVAEHYKGINMARLAPAVLKKPLSAYVSYRKQGRIYWTSKAVPIAPGEIVLTDGEHSIRARCGNRISLTPQQPVIAPTSSEPSIADFETAEPMLQAARPNWNYGDLSPASYEGANEVIISGSAVGSNSVFAASQIGTSAPGQTSTSAGGGLSSGSGTGERLAQSDGMIPANSAAPKGQGGESEILDFEAPADAEIHAGLLNRILREDFTPNLPQPSAGRAGTATLTLLISSGSGQPADFLSRTEAPNMDRTKFSAGSQVNFGIAPAPTGHNHGQDPLAPTLNPLPDSLPADVPEPQTFGFLCAGLAVVFLTAKFPFARKHPSA